MSDSYTRALADHQRSRREATLTCSVCHTANAPGRRPIELDELGVATCPCGYWWLPVLEDLALGYGGKCGNRTRDPS